MGDVWTTVFLDVFFLILAAFFMADPKFVDDAASSDSRSSVERMTVDLSHSAAAEGTFALVTGRTVIEIGDRVRIDGDVTDWNMLSDALTAAERQGAQEAVLKMDRDVPIQRYVHLLGVLKRAGYTLVRIPVIVDEPRKGAK